eukprot:1143632-Pyramimonas_sp.AAC.1
MPPIWSIWVTYTALGGMLHAERATNVLDLEQCTVRYVLVHGPDFVHPGSHLFLAQDLQNEIIWSFEKGSHPAGRHVLEDCGAVFVGHSAH